MRKSNSHRFTHNERIMPVLYIRPSLNYLRAKYVGLHVIKPMCEYLFYYLKIAIVMREQSKFNTHDDKLSSSGYNLK